MDLKMHRELPVLKRCCFCIPLRRGLIGWGYARLILNILTICYLIMIMMWIFNYVRVMYLSIYFAMLAFVFVDIVFTALLIVACHTKNFKLLRISYIYSTAWIILYMAFAAYGLIKDIIRTYWMWDLYHTHKFFIIDLMATSALIFTTVFIQLYVILLTRSETLKLQTQSLEMQFVNNAAEAEARCVSTDKGHTSVQYVDDKHINSEYTDNGHGSSVQYETY